jgi:hypothetical protein
MGIKKFCYTSGLVLRELLSDERLEGCQHFGFKQYKNANGDRILACDANGSITFQLAQIHVGEGTVPISIVLYIDGIFIKRGIPIRPVYCELYIYTMVYSMLYTMVFSKIYIIINCWYISWYIPWYIPWYTIKT